MKATNIFKDKKFIKCLKKWTFDEKGNHIKILNNKDGILKKNIDKVTYIDCSNYWITNIKGISIFRNLKILVLFNTWIKNLPKEIWKLKKLEMLDLDYNQIKKLPKEICRLNNLKILDLSDNQIKKLSKEIGSLVSLENLYLNKNQLRYLPSEICNLKNLKNLYLSYNQLQWLPAEILELKKLEKIKLNNAFDLNNLKQDPKELFDILQKLEERDLLGYYDLYYLKKEVYPILAKKIKEKYKVDDLKQIKDNLNIDNLSF